MPLPLLIVIPSVVTGVVGLVKSGSAISKNKRSTATMVEAQEIFDKAQKRMAKQKSITKNTLSKLGKARLSSWQDQVGDFVKVFSKMKNVELLGNVAHDGKPSSIDDKIVSKMVKISNNATAVLSSTTAATSAGVLAGIGAYSGVTTLATASTTTAISSLSGAAAANATMAWFGGGSLAAGGYGMAGGAYVLGGVIAGPALLIGGFVLDAKAQKRLAEARGNLAKSKVAVAKINRAITALKTTRKVGESFTSALQRLSDISQVMLNKLSDIVDTVGPDYGNYTEKQKKITYACVEVVGMLVKALEAPIMTENGSLKRGITKKIEAFSVIPNEITEELE